MKSIGEIIAVSKETNNILTGELIASLDPATEEIREYINDDNKKDRDIFCKTCGKKRTCFGFRGKVRCVCKCQLEAIQAEDKERERALAAQRVKNMRISSLLGERYKDATFEKTESHSEAYSLIYNRCRKYCDVAEEALEKGYSIYLYGDNGTGKTHLTACMANNLMEAGYSVLFTNIADIAKAIKATFNKSSTETEQMFFDKLTSVGFLFIDDFGKEIVKKGDEDTWLQNQIFEIINKRYNNRRPIIISSNYSLAELMTDRGVDKATVERIAEVCKQAIMKLEGESFRMKANRCGELPF